MIGGALAAAGFWIASAAVGPAVVAPEAPVLTASSVQLLASTVEASHLRDGQLEVAGNDQSRSLRVDVRPPEGFGPWRLTLRRQAQGDAPSLRWKPSGETAEYQPVDLEPAIVARQPEGGDAHVRLDMIWEIGWDTPPGHYGSSLEFELEPL